MIIVLSVFSNFIEGEIPEITELEVFIIDTIRDLPNEEWREIKGYGGKYLCSNMGRIKSLKSPKARLLTAFVNNKGYLRVALSKDG